MDSTVMLVATMLTAVLSVLVMGFIVSRQRRKLDGVLPLLRERGGMTLNEIAAALGTSVFAKGYLMQALNQLSADGRLTRTPPPKGHPMLRIAGDTRYTVA